MKKKPFPGYSQCNSRLAITLGPQSSFLKEAKSASDFKAVCKVFGACTPERRKPQLTAQPQARSWRCPGSRRWVRLFLPVCQTAGRWRSDPTSCSKIPMSDLPVSARLKGRRPHFQNKSRFFNRRLCDPWCVLGVQCAWSDGEDKVNAI